MSADSVGLGIAGTGRWAGAHAEAAARSSEVSIVSCFSPSVDGREAFAAEHGVAEAAASLDQLLDNDDVEAVIVSTPNETHLEIATAALATGRPVLVDKPVTADLSQGLALLRTTGEGGPACAVAHQARRLAGHRATRRWLDAHPRADARVAHASFANFRGTGLPEDSWKRFGPGAEGGVLTQVGIHQVDNLVYLLGPARTVGARFSHSTAGPDIAESAALVIGHTGGALSTLTTAWTTPGHYRLDVLTTGGNLSFTLDYDGWRSPEVDTFGELVVTEPERVPATVPLVAGDPLVEQLEELASAARGRGSVEIDVAAGLRTVAVVHGAITSVSRGGDEVDLAEILRDAGASSAEIELILGRRD